MPDLDDLIRGRLQARARPVDASPALFDSIDRRRAHRVVVRRTASALTTIAFLVAVVGGFVLVGRSAGPGPATQTPAATGPQNGLIVSVVDGPAVSHSSLWAGSTQLTPNGTLVGETGFIDGAPSVNPLGSLVAFTRQMSVSAGAGLYTVPFHGTPAGPCPTCGFAATRVLDSSWIVADPAWSPDGSKIAFAGGGRSRAAGIYVIGLNPPSPPKLVYAAPTDLSVVAHPSWSPDGSKLVFAQANGALSTPPNYDLYLVAADGTGSATDITPGGSDSQVQPAWSPDGKRIAFVSQSGASAITRSALATISPDGTSLKTLIGGVLFVQNPAWSPDGKQTVFDSETQPGFSGQIGIFTMPATGGAQHFVRFGSDPAWQPVPATNTGLGLAPTTNIPGLAYPVCQADVISATLIRSDPNAQVYLFSTPGQTGCTPHSPTFLATTIHGLGPFPSTVVSGPIACNPSCRILAAPALGSGGTNELAVVVTGGGGMSGVQLYRASTDGHFVPVLTSLGDSFYFNWGLSETYAAGIACLGSRANSAPRLDVWTATHRGGVWVVDSLLAHLRGSTMIKQRIYVTTARDVTGLPSGGGTDFCGAHAVPVPPG